MPVSVVAEGSPLVRLRFAMLVGYPLHKLWDLLHEFQAHGAHPAFEPAS
ncbi:MAG: hypothetical protein WA628_17165 [Terriglobales bacterium]